MKRHTNGQPGACSSWHYSCGGDGLLTLTRAVAANDHATIQRLIDAEAVHIHPLMDQLQLMCGDKVIFAVPDVSAFLHLEGV